MYIPRTASMNLKLTMNRGSTKHDHDHGDFFNSDFSFLSIK